MAMTEQQQQQQFNVSPTHTSTNEEPKVASMSSEELRKECNSLRKQNALLNCRLLGVNELARLLQEKTEAADSLQDKNKRLELAVVRLENRSSNLEKKLKTSQFSSLPSSSGNPSIRSHSQQSQQSPFIPGPSKQILETLMKENTDLKKTLDNMTKKGPTGYREAVKVNQLEEVIDQKNEKIELLRGQLDSMTASQEGGDMGALRRQLLKMEQSMQVKDRFCSLLSDSVNQLQKELQETKKGYEETDFGVGQNRADSGISSLSKEHEVKERNLRKMIDELQGQVERERNEKRDALTQADESCQKLIEKQAELEGLQSRLDDSNLYTQTLLQDKMALKDQLENARRNGGNSSEIKDVSYYMTQMENKDAQIDRLKQMLEEAQYKYALAESKHDNLQVGDLEDKLKDLEEEKLGLESEIAEHKRQIQELQIQNKKLKSGSSYVPTSIRTGGASTSLRSYHGDEVFADGSKSFHDITARPEVPPINYTSRNVDTDSTTSESTTTSVATPTYTSSDSDTPTRPLPLPSSSSRMAYRTSVPGTPGLPYNTNPAYMMSHHPSQGTYTDMQRHGYQPMDSHSAYQTHSMMSGGMPQVGGTGYRFPRSLSSSPGPYVSSIPYTASSSSHPSQGIVTQASIFGQPHASPYSMGGYTTTPTAGYTPSQYPGIPGQRYDISQYYGAGAGSNFFNTGTSYHSLPPPSSQSSNVGNPSGQSGQGGQGGASQPTGQGHMRRHSPPDPRYGNPQQ